MIFTILLGLKFIWFTYLINVEKNRLLVALVSLLISIFILSLIYRKDSKTSNRKALIFYTIISAIVFVDAAYYTHFSSLPSILAVKQVGQLAAAGDSLRVLIGPRLLVLILDIPLLIYYIGKTCYRPAVTFFVRRIVPYIVGVLFLGIVLTLYFTDKLSLIGSQEVYSYHVTDIVETIFRDDEDIIEEVFLTTDDIEDLRSRARLKEGRLTGLGQDKNLIVIQVEALQNFVINLEYEGQEITPNLNRFINNSSSLYYDNYFQMLGKGNTSDAEFVTQNSLYPSMEEPTYFQYEDNTFYGLPWLLRDYGYTAWAFHGFEKEYWNREKAYQGQGFQRFVNQEDFEFEEVIGFGIRDGDFLDQTIDYLKELDSLDDNPFYAFVVTLTSHTPFIMPEEYHILDIREEHKDNMLGDYLQAIHYVDRELGRFITNLMAEGLYEDTVIAIYGDHYAISALKEEAPLMEDLIGEPYDLDYMMNVPLIIHIPGEDIQETISIVGSQLDFYPTIANIMGCDNKKGLVFGRDLNNCPVPNYVAPQTYMVKGSFISNDTLFEMSRDEIFEHSRAINRRSRASLDIEGLRLISENMCREIDKSNYILKMDLLKDLLDEADKKEK